MLAVKSVLSSVTDGWKYTKMMVIKTEHKIKATLRVIQQPCCFGCLTLPVPKDFTGFLKGKFECLIILADLKVQGITLHENC